MKVSMKMKSIYRLLGFGLLTTCLIGATVLAAPTKQKDADDPTLRDYLSGNGLLNRGLYELATSEYRKFLAEHSDHDRAPLARYGLAVGLYRMKRFKDAVKELKQLRKIRRFNYAVEVATILGQCQLALQNYAEAGEAYEYVARTHPKHDLADEAAAGAVEAFYLDGRHDETITWAQVFMSRWPDNPLRERVLFFWGLSEMTQDVYHDAAERFSDLLKDFSEGPFADQSALLLARCHERDDNNDAAIQHYIKVIKRSNDRQIPDSLLALGLLLQQQGEFQEAGKYLDQLIDRYSDSKLIPSAQLLRGRVWFEQDEFEHAFTSFQHASKTAKKNDDTENASDAAYWMAKCKLRQEKYSSATKRLDRAIKQFPGARLLPEMYYDLGITCVRAGEYDHAIKALKTFRNRFDQHELSADVLHMLATAEHQQSRFKKSQKYAEAFLEEFPDHILIPTIAFLVAENDFLAGKYALASEEFRQFLTDHPNDEQTDKARFRLGTSLYRLDQFDEADTVLSEVTRGDSTGASFQTSLLALGDIYFQRSEWDKAQEYLSRYLAHGDDAASADDALLKLGLSYQRQEQPEKALEAYDRLLQNHPDSTHRLQAMFEQGQALVMLERFDEAAEVLEKVVTEGDESEFVSFALNHLASIGMRRKEYQSTAELFARVEQSSSESEMKAEALFNQGQALMGAQQFDAAEKTFQKLLEQYPSHERITESKARLAIAIARQNRYEDALKVMEELARSSKGELDIKLRKTLQYEMAWCLRELGHPDAAAKAYGVLIQKDQTGEINVHALLELAGIEFDAKHYEKSADLLRRLHSLSASESNDIPQNVIEPGIYRLAVSEFELGRYEQAAELFEELMQKFPDSSLIASASFFCGEALFKMNRFEKAAGHLSRVIRKHSDDEACAPSMLRLGECNARLQHWSESERVFSGFLQRFSDNEHWFQAEFGVGWAREHQKRFNEAILAYRKVISKHHGPTSARAQFQIGECLFASERYDEAVRELLKVDILYAYPEWSAAALYEAGRCFEKLGKIVEARNHFKQVANNFSQTRWAELASERLTALPSSTLPGQ